MPTLRENLRGAQERRDLLLAIYSEVGSNGRALTDVRFKLLGLVPAVSLAIWGVLISSELLTVDTIAAMAFQASSKVNCKSFDSDGVFAQDDKSKTPLKLRLNGAPN